MQNRHFLSILAFCGGICAAVSFTWLPKESLFSILSVSETLPQRVKKKKSAFNQTHLIEYDFYRVTTGEVLPLKGIQEYFPPPGEQISELLVKPMDRVSASQPLYLLDDRPLVRELEEAQREQIEEILRLNQLLKPYECEELAMAQKELEVELAVLESEQKELSFYRSIDPLAMPPMELEKSEMRVKVQQLQVEKQQAKLAFLSKKVDPSLIQTQEAKVALVKGKISRLLADMQQKTVCATDPGLILKADKQGITLADTSELCLKVALDARDVSKYSDAIQAVAICRKENEIYKLKFHHFDPVVQVKEEGIGALRLGEQRIVYAYFVLETRQKPFFIGQLLDVYVETEELS